MRISSTNIAVAVQSTAMVLQDIAMRKVITKKDRILRRKDYEIIKLGIELCEAVTEPISEHISHAVVDQEAVRHVRTALEALLTSETSISRQDLLECSIKIQQINVRVY